MRDVLNGIFRFIIWALMVIILTILINKFVLQIVVVTGDSMNDSFENGQMLLVDKLMWFNDIERYDVVVFDSQDQYNRYLIKRVYGLPGDTIRIENSTIFINNVPIKDPYKKEAGFKAGIAAKEIKLKKGEYFLLGDNRNNSFDSRYEQLGVIKENRIVGETFMSLNPIGFKMK